MITSLKSENFRGFTTLSIEPLKRVNLIGGADNAGKTAILEGLYLLFSSNHTGPLIQTLPGVFRSRLAEIPMQVSHDDFRARPEIEVVYIRA
jgi:recombinational DNA repair ATPase RecF